MTAVLEDRVEGSCEYVFTNSEFLEWRRTSSDVHRNVLWIHGNSGYGKTTTAASIVETISRNLDSTCIVAYAFCAQLSVVEILRSLIWQVTQRQGCAIYSKECLLEAYREYTNPGPHESLSRKEQLVFFKELLVSCLQPYYRITLVLDGVDQGGSSEELVQQFLTLSTKISRNSKRCDILFTSRFQYRISEKREDVKTNVLQIKPVDIEKSITLYLENACHNVAPCLSDSTKAEIISKLLANVDSGWLRIAHDLAQEFLRVGRFLAAEQLAASAVEIRGRSYGREHAQTLASMRLLALAIHDQGRWREAETLQRQVIQVWKDKRDLEDPRLLTLENDLSLTLMALEQWQEAENLQLHLMHSWKDDKNVRVNMNQLAQIYKGQERFDEAEDMSRQLLAYYLSALGDEENILIHKSNLGMLLAERQKWEEGEALLREVMEARVAALGRDDLKSLQCISNLGWTLSEKGDPQAAKPLQLEVLKGRTIILGDRHPDTINTLGVLAVTCSRLGEMKEATKYARMALGM